MFKRYRDFNKKNIRAIAWSFFEVAETLVISLSVVLLIRAFVAQPFLVSGASMEPTFESGDYLLVDELTHRFREPERGEVVVFKYPSSPRSFYIKRLIGLPGERIVITKGTVTVYKGEKGEILEEDYTMAARTFGYLETKLGEDEYFVMGDNRNFSFDSRSWGPLKRENIVGITRLRLWPITKVMAFGAPDY